MGVAATNYGSHPHNLLLIAPKLSTVKLPVLGLHTLIGLFFRKIMNFLKIG